MNLVQRVVFCHMAMDVYREFQFMKLGHVESDVFLAPVICFLPSCFHQLLGFTPQYLSCSPLSFTTRDQRGALFPSSHLSQGLSIKTPGDRQRDQHDSRVAGSRTGGQEQDGQNGGVRNHTHSCDHSQHVRSGKRY